MELVSSKLPEAFVQRVREFIPSPNLPDVLKSFAHHKPLSFRINTLLADKEEVTHTLTQRGFELQPVSWYDTAFYSTNKTAKDLSATESYKKGHIYIQNLSSMIPALVLSPESTDKVLDIAAAPGSKTTQMASLMHNRGEIVANDLSRERMFKLRRILDDQGVTNTKTMSVPGQKLWRNYPEYFDKTLVDVPCSMEGRFCLLEPETYHDWSLRKVKDLVKHQRYLLRSAISATRPGGIIVYSSCTLSPEENEGVIDWVVTKEKEAVVLEPIELDGLSLVSGLIFWQKELNSDLVKTKRVLPSQLMEGFFVAKIRKIRTTTPYFS